MSPLALANSMGIFVFLLHPLFHIWVAIDPESYVMMVRLFAPGITASVSVFDYSIVTTIVATILKAAVFWGIGYAIGWLYNLTQQKN